MLRKLRVRLRHFRHLVQFVQPNFSIQRVTAARINDLDVLYGDIRNLVVLLADNAGRRDIAGIIFRRSFVFISCVRFRCRDFGINIRDMHVVHPATTTFTAFSHHQIDRISGIDGTEAIHYHIFNLSAINRLDRYGRTERIEYSIIDNLYILEATRRSRTELNTACT